MYDGNGISVLSVGVMDISLALDLNKEWSRLSFTHLISLVRMWFHEFLILQYDGLFLGGILDIMTPPHPSIPTMGSNFYVNINLFFINCMHSAPWMNLKFSRKNSKEAFAFFACFSFCRNDYEMLLALDENVHHIGTSSNQINSLPESKVQVSSGCEKEKVEYCIWSFVAT